MKVRALIMSVLLICLYSCSTHNDGFIPLFDGHTLEGWEGDTSVFRVIDGALVGGTLEAPIEESKHLCTSQKFKNFELRITAKIEGQQNAGVGFRCERLQGSTEVAGYQADMGLLPAQYIPLVSDITDFKGEFYPLWGSLLDEFRNDPGRYPDPENPYHLISVADRLLVESVLKTNDWNDVMIKAEGAQIKLWLNGVQTVDFFEEQDVPQSGLICLQLHSGEPSKAWYKDILILVLESD